MAVPPPFEAAPSGTRGDETGFLPFLVRLTVAARLTGRPEYRSQSTARNEVTKIGSGEWRRMVKYRVEQRSRANGRARNRKQL